MTYDPVVGDLLRTEEMRSNRVKGNLVLSRRWFLAERAEKGAIPRVLSALRPESQALIERPVMPFSWVNFGLLMEVDQAIIEQVMHGRVEGMWEFGRQLGIHDIGTIYRVFFSLASPEFVLRRVSALGSLYFQESTLGFESKQSGHGRVELVGRCMPRYMCNYGISGWLTAVLEAAKATGIAVEHAQCVHRGAARCEWSCRWDGDHAFRPSTRP